MNFRHHFLRPRGLASLNLCRTVVIHPRAGEEREKSPPDGARTGEESENMVGLIWRSAGDDEIGRPRARGCPRVQGAQMYAIVRRKTCYASLLCCSLELFDVLWTRIHSFEPTSSFIPDPPDKLPRPRGPPRTPNVITASSNTTTSRPKISF